MQFLQETGVGSVAQVRDAGGQHSLVQLLAGRHPQALVIEERALALLGPEQLVGDGIVGDGGDNGAFALESDIDGEVRDGVQEVGGAVQRVDDPGVGLVGPLDQAALLAKEAVAGAGLGQRFEDHLLGLEVGGGDEIGRRLFGHLQLAEFAEIAVEAARRLARGVAHHLQEGGLGAHGVKRSRSGRDP